MFHVEHAQESGQVQADERVMAHPPELDLELAQLKERLAHAQRLAALGTVAGMIAHEFNNILTPVLSYAQLALATPEDRSLSRKALEHAAAGSERAAQIATAILDFARFEPNGSDVDATITDVERAVQGVLACMARDPTKDRLRLTVDVPRGTSVQMRPVPIQQILLNLILNARKAIAATGKPGSVTIKASLAGSRPLPPASAAVPTTIARTHDGPWVVIEVIDTGCGMPHNQLVSAFDAFASCSHSGGSGYRGTGLGLTICQQLIAQAGGYMWATSTPGVGSTFAFAVPGAASAGASHTLPREAKAA